MKIRDLPMTILCLLYLDTRQNAYVSILIDYRVTTLKAAKCF